MFDYISNFFDLKSNVVESKLSKKDSFNTFILYDYSPFMIIPSTLKSFKKSHKGKFWYNIRRSKRVVEDELGEFSFQKHYNSDALLYLDEFRTLFLTRWKNDYTSFGWKNDSGFNKFKSQLDKIILNYPDTFEIATLRLKSDNKLLAYSLGFVLNNSYYFFMHNVNLNFNKSKYSLGTIFLEDLIKSFIGNKNVKNFDFMLGLNPYKMKWTKTIKPIYWHIYTIKSFKGFFIHYFKVFVFYSKIKIQKNQQLSTFLKKVFFKLSKVSFLAKIFRYLDKYLFKM